jgi:ketosteroid isomerase-like protein
MSQENVEVVRGLFESYARGDTDPEQYLAADVVWNPADESPQTGLDDALAYIERWESEWEDLNTIPEEFIDAGESVFTTVHFSGRGRGSGIEVDTRLYEVWTLREGKVVRMDEFTDRAEALEAVGLRE